MVRRRDASGAAPAKRSRSARITRPLPITAISPGRADPRRCTLRARSSAPERFNAVAPGLLKTSASAGIPGYVDAYLYAEQATLRKRALQTEEAAAVAAFLLSPRSSGINAQNIVGRRPYGARVNAPRWLQVGLKAEF